VLDLVDQPLVTSPPPSRATRKYSNKRVCLSVCSHISETARPNFTIFVRVDCGRGSLHLWRPGRTLYTVLPVLWMTQ